MKLAKRNELQVRFFAGESQAFNRDRPHPLARIAVIPPPYRRRPPCASLTDAPPAPPDQVPCSLISL